MNFGDNNERVRRSSGGTLGAVKLENDFAADFSTWREAVRLDLKDLNLSDEAGGVSTMSGISRLTSSSQSSGLKCSKG